MAILSLLTGSVVGFVSFLVALFSLDISLLAALGLYSSVGLLTMGFALVALAVPPANPSAMPR